MKQTLFFIALIFLVLSCKDQNSKQLRTAHVIHRSDYSIKVELANLNSHEIYELNNYYLGAPVDSLNSFLPKAFTLYHMIKESKSKFDTSATLLTQANSDSLFILSNSYLKSFSFELFDTTQTNSRVLRSCPTMAKVELFFDGQILSGSITEIENTPNAQFSLLLQYIKRITK